MATTTQVTSYRSAGQPDDGVASIGDVCIDTTNRGYWVKQGNNSWVGGFQSSSGPTGPGLLSYPGVPPAAFGQNGQAAYDTTTMLLYSKSNNAWTATGTSVQGPQGSVGLTGYSALTSQVIALGPQSGTTSGTTLSSTATAVPLPGTTIPLSFAPNQSSAVMGLVCTNNGSAIVFSLYDTTASATVFSASIPSNANFNTAYTASQYPLVAGHNYQWMITGSGTANYTFTPFYLSPSASTAPSVSFLTGFTTASGTTFSGTAIYPAFGTNVSSGLTRTYYPLRAGGVYGYQAVYVPSSVGAAAASVTATIYLYNNAAGSGLSTLGSFSFANTGKYQAGMFGSVLSLPLGQSMYIGYTGSGSGQVSVDLQVIV